MGNKVNVSCLSSERDGLLLKWLKWCFLPTSRVRCPPASDLLHTISNLKPESYSKMDTSCS